MRAMFSGVTGIRAHQLRLDVIGNNIANVNTSGFKASRVTFQDVFSQTMRGGSTGGGAASLQVGLGAAVGTVDLLAGAGNLQFTGRDLDLAIEGSGFFILANSDGTETYSRSGGFDWNSAGYLVNPGSGQSVLGWVPQTDGTWGTKDAGNLTALQLPIGDVALAQPTTAAAFAQNLDAAAAVGASHTTSVLFYDSLGRTQSFTFEFTKTDDNEWDVGYYLPGDNVLTPLGSIEFSTSGAIIDPDPPEFTLDGFTPDGAEELSLVIDFSRVTQTASGGAGHTLLVQHQNGVAGGTLDNVAIDAGGMIWGVYSNGAQRVIAQIAVANFTNPGGLVKQGANGFIASQSSGLPQVGEAGRGGRGRVAPANLEMSNVDLSAEFTNMIMTQRGFQANTRIITVSDEMMQELVNLKR